MRNKLANTLTFVGLVAAFAGLLVMGYHINEFLSKLDPATSYSAQYVQNVLDSIFNIWILLFGGLVTLTIGLFMHD